MNCKLQDASDWRSQGIAVKAGGSLQDWKELVDCTCNLTCSSSGRGRRTFIYIYIYIYIYIRLPVSMASMRP